MASNKQAGANPSAAQRQAPRAGAFPGFDPGKALGGLPMPSMDVETMAAAQRKNVEALTAVCQLAFDCVQASAQRQAALIRDTAEEMIDSFRTLSASENPQSQAASQMAVGRHALERGMSSLRELAELVAKTNTQAFEILNHRASASLKEIQDAVSDGKGPKD